MRTTIQPGTFVMALVLTIVLSAASLPVAVYANSAASYVGSSVCGQCHEDQYESYMKYSKKSKSYMVIYQQYFHI